MGIHKAASHIEAYRAKAGARDINELSGRTGRPDLTAFVSQQIAQKLPLKPDAVLVDVGCGDGSLLVQAADRGVCGYQGRLIGLLPTTEEVSRVRAHLLAAPQARRAPIAIEVGLAEQTTIPDRYCDLLVCNGVLVVLPGEERIRAALTEFQRITKPGATVFIGEVPERDEMAGKTYGDSISGWLYWVLRNQGLHAFWLRLKQTVKGLVGSEPFVISPKKLFHMPPSGFIALLAQHGLEVVEHFRHPEVSQDGRLLESGTRWDFVAVRR